MASSYHLQIYCEESFQNMSLRKVQLTASIGQSIQEGLFYHDALEFVYRFFRCCEANEILVERFVKISQFLFSSVNLVMQVFLIWMTGKYDEI